ncbi:Abi family protein [Oceanobacillus oncorhynchi subsp. oncorhynchi]|uniref:Abi family protein n=1 Tax=Oceanobacillus oncorhynchi TaxID=545501 RepID=UPI0031D58D40
MEVVDKPFIDLDKQIKKLTSRGLKILNVEKAKHQLIKTTYYDLINGYKDMFLLPKSTRSEDDKFIDGTTIEDIIELYELDRQIRNATLEILLDIECRFYSSVSYSLGKLYGEKEEDYLNIDNFKRGKIQTHNNRLERVNLFEKIEEKIHRPRIQPLKYYRRKYGNIPPWILVKDLTFGEIVKLYQLSPRELKVMVVSNILGHEPNENDFEYFSSGIKLFNTFRNWAAHGGRMYNFKSRIEFPFIEYHHEVFSINKGDYNKGRGKKDFTALITATLFFLKKDYQDIIEFLIKIRTYLDHYQKSNPLQYEKVLFEMGLPSNYYQSLHNTMFK